MSVSVEFPSGSCEVGVSRADITPPVGIYHRMWGAATHDRSTGVHQDLTATVLIMQPAGQRGVEHRVAWIGLDHCLLWPEEMDELLDHLTGQTELSRDQIVILFSHTHAAGLMGHERESLPGGELIAGYLQTVAETLVECIHHATATLTPAWLTAATGRCGLATNRDFFDAERQEYVCGFNPDRKADDLVQIIRITRVDSGSVLASVVNYACHPTTLAWDNTLISPDYPGAMRAVVEEHTGAPCLFIQGASGDVGPRDGFVGDLSVAERNGASLGHAVLAAWNLMPPPATRFDYTGAVVSGATIGTWQHVGLDDSQLQNAARWEVLDSAVDLPYRDDLPDRNQLLAEDAEWQVREQAAINSRDTDAARDARAMRERIQRRLTRVKHLEPSPTCHYPFRVWRIGDIFWVPLNGEHYNVLQVRLRERFPEAALVIGTLANGSYVWYLPDRDSYGLGLYQETASVLAQGALETLESAIGDVIGTSRKWSLET